MKSNTKKRNGGVRGTKESIIDTARRLFSEYSYLGISMDDIAKKLNITKAALYYHYTGKAEIYEKVLDDVFHNLKLVITEALNETTIDKRLFKLINNYLNFGAKEKNLIKALIVRLPPAEHKLSLHISSLLEQVSNLIQPVMKEVSTSKMITKKVDDRLLTSLLISMMNGLLLEYAFLNKKLDPTRIADQIITVFFADISPIPSNTNG